MRFLNRHRPGIPEAGWRSGCTVPSHSGRASDGSGCRCRGPGRRNVHVHRVLDAIAHGRCRSVARGPHGDGTRSCWRRPCRKPWRHGSAANLSISGRKASWTDVLTPIKTYKSKSGHWCREYVRQTTFSGLDLTIQGTACRDENGTWTTVFRRTGFRQVRAADGMTPGSRARTG